MLFTRVPPRSSRTGSYQARLANRGLYDLGPMQISSRFPLGLMERVIEVGDVERLVVFPQVGRLLPELGTWPLSYNNLLVEQPRSRKGSFDDEFHQLREYRTGDNPRRHSLADTARRNMLMVREFHQNRDQDLLAGRSTCGSRSGRRRRTATASNWRSASPRRCASSTAGTPANRSSGWAWQQPWPTTGKAKPPLRRLDAVLERLAVAEASTKSDLEDLLRRSECPFQRPARRVLVSTRPTKPFDPNIPGDVLVLSAASGALTEYFERDAG